MFLVRMYAVRSWPRYPCFQHFDDDDETSFTSGEVDDHELEFQKYGQFQSANSRGDMMTCPAIALRMAP